MLRTSAGNAFAVAGPSPHLDVASLRNRDASVRPVVESSTALEPLPCRRQIYATDCPPRVSKPGPSQAARMTLSALAAAGFQAARRSWKPRRQHALRLRANSQTSVIERVSVLPQETAGVVSGEVAAPAKAAAKEDAADVNLARLLLVGTAACWGTYPVVIKLFTGVAGDSVDPSLVTAIRFVLMTILSLPLLAAASSGSAQSSTDSSAEQAPRLDMSALAVASFELALLGTAGTVLNTWGIEHTTAIRAALLLSSVNILTPLLSVLIGTSAEDRNVQPIVWVGCAASFAATAYATLGGTASGVVSEGLGQGDLAVLAATLCYSCIKVRLSEKAKSFPPEVFTFTRLGCSAIVGCSLVALECLAGSEAGWAENVGRMPAEAWGLLLFSAAMSGVVASYLQVKGQKIVPPAQAQTIFACVPLFVGVYDLIFLHDVPETRELIAAAVVVAAAALTSGGGAKAAK
eukprot:TRINITY_DN12886_c0_g1_i1.p1 TRINITY_DN12886_c0_g1~~TRINITY_DN12886_c0_g1_i1.p1  ORF type:complete len:481 (-),score=81.36 TRINITY_DN12886_c0_g1_i1:141-1526(-)